jgi:signal transduction histidine kinase
VLLAVLGGLALAAAVPVGLARGQTSEAEWVLIGPLPFYLIGLAGFLRRPDNRAVQWLLWVGVGFVIGSSVGEVLAPLAGGSAAVPEWAYALIWLVHSLADHGGAFAGLGLLAFFPSGRPSRPFERWVLGIAGAEAVLLPLVILITQASEADSFGAGPRLPQVLAVPGLLPYGHIVSVLSRTYVLWEVLGFGILTVRYRRTDADERRRIRFFLFGTALSAVFGWLPLLLGSALVRHETSATNAVFAALTVIALGLPLASLLVALFHNGVFGIDQPSRRAQVGCWLEVAIAAGLVAVAVAAGLAVGLVAPAPVAIGTAAVVMAGLQVVRRRALGFVDRAIFGARLDGYLLLDRLGTALERSPGSAELLRELAGTVRRALNVTWVRVTLSHLPSAVVTAGSPEGEPEATVDIVHDGVGLGRIESGPRVDGPLLGEDRRLLEYFGRQAGAAMSNLHLTAELAAQTRELAASRDRIVQARDAERRRIQRDLHDGVQQEIVALTAKVGLGRQWLRRGRPGTEEILGELQRDLGALLDHVRDVAYAMYPPVLSDRGLLEAVEAQAGKLALPMAVRADPALRGMRFPPPIEATAWYVLAEALSNVVKHAQASEVEVSLHRVDGALRLAVRDDGLGFDPALVAGGLGLAGLSDRLGTVNGSVNVDSAVGQGTLVTVRIPLELDKTHA